MILGVNGLI